MFTRHDTVELFRNRLQEVIDRSGLSRAAFARKTGMDRSTLTQILSDSTDRLPRVETLAAIAHCEQVSIDWLVGLSQEGRLGADVLNQSVEIERGGSAPSDAHLERWHAEAIGYKIRHVPTNLPDILKTPEVIEYEYRLAARTTPEQREETRLARLEYQRRPETDMEVCTSVQGLRGLVLGEGIWSGLPAETRTAQARHILQLSDELYPGFRWFLYDGLSFYSVPFTVFGPKRAVIYLGQRYFVLNSREHIEVLSAHFDELIRAAVIEPTQVGTYLRSLLDEKKPKK